MSIEHLMDHICDIYHITPKQNSPGYGLPVSPTFDYEKKPDIENQICHFSIKNTGITIIQGEPQTEVNGRIKLIIPIGTDIRFNDKIVSKESGLAYRAEFPRNIRGHHKIAYLNREAGVKGAI